MIIDPLLKKKKEILIDNMYRMFHTQKQNIFSLGIVSVFFLSIFFFTLIFFSFTLTIHGVGSVIILS